MAEISLEHLRPLVEIGTWDFCVIWKSGDDPTRFVEWAGCCCSGGFDYAHVKKEDQSEEESCILGFCGEICRDPYFQHPIRAKACEALAQLPYYIPLYSGIHGEVVLSGQARWLANFNVSESDEQIGTRVMIPVYGGLIELFSPKHILRDQMMIDDVQAKFNYFMEPELAVTINPSFGSSNGADPSQFPVSEVIQTPILDMGFVDLDGCKQFVMNAKKAFKSKNLNAERSRRRRINVGLLTLRSLVPNISKMDKASIPGDAIQYIRDLQEKVRKLQSELNQEETVSNKTNVQCNIGKSNCLHLFKPKTDCGSVNTSKPIQAQVDVQEVGTMCFTVKIMCSHSPSWFTKLMKVMCSLGFELLDANVTTFHGKVLSIFQVKAGDELEASNPKNLKDSVANLAEFVRLGF